MSVCPVDCGKTDDWIWMPFGVIGWLGSRIRQADKVEIALLEGTISCFIKVHNGLPFWCRLTQVVLERRPLNGCSSKKIKQ